MQFAIANCITALERETLTAYIEKGDAKSRTEISYFLALNSLHNFHAILRGALNPRTHDFMRSSQPSNARF